MQGTMVGHRPGSQSLDRLETQVLRVGREDVIGVDHLAGHPETEAIGVRLHHVRQGVDGKTTTPQGQVLPPGIGRHCRAVRPQPPGGALWFCAVKFGGVVASGVSPSNWV